SVRMRLVSDVPLGVLLSGGIDSSAIAALAVRASSEPVKTFSISFAESSYDESWYARAVAKFLGTDHHEERLSANLAGNLVGHLWSTVFRSRRKTFRLTTRRQDLSLEQNMIVWPGITFGLVRLLRTSRKTC